MTVADLDAVTTADAAEAAGVSYRQADYWLRTGVMKVLVAAEGSGSRRAWTQDDIDVLRVLGRLSTAMDGKPQRSVLTACAAKAREIIDDGFIGDPVVLELTPDVTLTVETTR